MENTQSPPNQSPTGAGVQSKQSNSSKKKLFVVIVVTVLLTVIITGPTIYFWQRSVRRETINNLEQEAASLEKQVSIMKRAKVTPRPILSSAPSPTSIVGTTASWKTYTDTTHNFSLKYPYSWQVVKGNKYAPSIPSNMTEITNLQGKVGTISVSIIPWPNDLKKDLKQELVSFISNYFGDFDVSFKNTQLDGQLALRGNFIQPGMGNSQLKVIFTAVENGDYVLFFQTQSDTKDSSRLDLYNQILSTFKFTN